jgi:hypothetical protein
MSKKRKITEISNSESDNNSSIQSDLWEYGEKKMKRNLILVESLSLANLKHILDEYKNQFNHLWNTNRTCKLRVVNWLICLEDNASESQLQFKQNASDFTKIKQKNQFYNDSITFRATLERNLHIGSSSSNNSSSYQFSADVTKETLLFWQAFLVCMSPGYFKTQSQLILQLLNGSGIDEYDMENPQTLARNHVEEFAHIIPSIIKKQVMQSMQLSSKKKTTSSSKKKSSFKKQILSQSRKK